MTAPQTEAPWFSLRLAVPGDMRFVAETTARVLRPRDVAEVIWLRQTLPGFGARCATATCIVAEADGPVVGFGWAKDDVLGMLYVKREFRGEGVGIRILWALGLESPVKVSQVTPSWRAWCHGRRMRWEEVR